MKALIETLLIFSRLILYPLMALSMVIYAFSGEGNNKSAKLHIFISGFFMMLWGASITVFLTNNEEMVVRFNNYGLLPVLVVILIYTWTLTVKNNKEWLIKEKERKLQTEKEEKENGNQIDV